MNTTQNEEWRDVRGFEGRYEVSSLGRVRSVRNMVRGVSKAGKEFKRPSPSKVLRPGRCRGYLIVNLSGFGTIGLHILVARAFCEGEAADREVNHDDGNKHNCAAANLEWVTKTRNMEHAVDNGLNTQAIRVVDPASGKIYPSMTRAAKVAKVAISRVRSTWSRA